MSPKLPKRSIWSGGRRGAHSRLIIFAILAAAILLGIYIQKNRDTDLARSIDPSNYAYEPASDILCRPERVETTSGGIAPSDLRVAGFRIGDAVGSNDVDPGPRLKIQTATRSVRLQKNEAVIVTVVNKSNRVAALDYREQSAKHDIRTIRRSFGEPASVWRSKVPKCPWTVRLLYADSRDRMTDTTTIDSNQICKEMPECSVPGMMSCTGDPSHKTASLFFDERSGMIRISVRDLSLIQKASIDASHRVNKWCSPFANETNE